MRGDASSQPSFSASFNTSSEFAAMVAAFMAQYYSSLDKIILAVNFQFPFEFGNFLAEEFLVRLSSLLSTYPKLEIGVGNIDDWVLEMDRVCRGQASRQIGNAWFDLEIPPSKEGEHQSPQLGFSKHAYSHRFEGNSSGDNLCTTARRAISQGRFFLQSSSANPFDPRDTTGRFKNFNVMYKAVPELCKNGFPAWIKKNPSFPLIFWEPSNERQIQWTLGQLLSEDCRKKHNRTAEGLALASNLDPEMFGLFSKPSRLTTSFLWAADVENLILQETARIELSAAPDSPVLAVATTASGRGDSTLWLVSSKEGKWQPSLSVASPNRIEGLYSLRNRYIARWPRSSQPPTFESPDRAAGQIQHELAGTPGATTVNPTYEGPFGNFGLTIYDTSLKAVAQSSVSQLVASFSDGSAVYFLTGTSDPGTFNLLSTQDGVSAKTITAFAMDPELAAQVTSMMVVLRPSGQEPGADSLVVVLAGSKAPQSWLGKVVAGKFIGPAWVLYGYPASLLPFADFAVGVIVENSYCHNGLLINNNAQAKCNLHENPATATLANVKHLVAGPLLEIEELIGLVDQPRLLTACNSNFAKLLNGDNVRGTFFQGKLIFAATYVPLSLQETPTTLFGGGSNGQNYPGEAVLLMSI